MNVADDLEFIRIGHLSDDGTPCTERCAVCAAHSRLEDEIARLTLALNEWAKTAEAAEAEVARLKQDILDREDLEDEVQRQERGHMTVADDLATTLMRQLLDAIRLVMAAEATDARKVAAISHLVERFPDPDVHGTSSVRIFLDAITQTQKAGTT